MGGLFDLCYISSHKVIAGNVLHSMPISLCTARFIKLVRQINCVSSIIAWGHHLIYMTREWRSIDISFIRHIIHGKSSFICFLEFFKHLRGHLQIIWICVLCRIK